jgi:3-phosphoshikimate 1-carboxyvinyltransferase
VKPRRVGPSGALRGTIRVPGDKSVSHRALLLNTLGQGSATIRGLLDSHDVGATMAAAQALGARIEREGASWRLHAPEQLQQPREVIDCGNSGTTMRLLCGVLAAAPFRSTLSGDASLCRRPMLRVVEPLRGLGATISGRDGGNLAPLTIEGGTLCRGRWDLSIASAQVKSCLLLAGLRQGIAVREPAQSRDHTERMLAAMGAPLEQEADGWWVLQPGADLQCVDVEVPGDISSAAFWMVAGSLVPESDILLQGVGVNPTRAGVIDALRLMGADIEVHELPSPSGEPLADIRVRGAALTGIVLEGDLALRCLDELPVLAVAASFAEGETRIADAAELRVKESDRIAVVANGLTQLGFQVEERPDGMCIAGGQTTSDAQVDANGDHRIAMAFSVAALAGQHEVLIHGAKSVLTSYPEFYTHLSELQNG